MGGIGAISIKQATFNRIGQMADFAPGHVSNILPGQVTNPPRD
jgi:hypothetical protein